MVPSYELVQNAIPAGNILPHNVGFVSLGFSWSGEFSVSQLEMLCEIVNVIMQ